jgi:hypothetical protein
VSGAVGTTGSNQNFRCDLPRNGELESATKWTKKTAVDMRSTIEDGYSVGEEGIDAHIDWHR